jgi:hypothetical protein
MFVWDLSSGKNVDIPAGETTLRDETWSRYFELPRVCLITHNIVR